jgi:hypothetical protein
VPKKTVAARASGATSTFASPWVTETGAVPRLATSAAVAREVAPHCLVPLPPRGRAWPRWSVSPLVRTADALVRPHLVLAVAQQLRLGSLRLQLLQVVVVVVLPLHLPPTAVAAALCVLDRGPFRPRMDSRHRTRCPCSV